MQPSAYAHPFTAASDIALLREHGVIPRNINLYAFDPHRKTFICARADARTPKVQAGMERQAQSLREQGMALSSPGQWPDERNFPEAVKRWQQAANLGDWKAAMMLVSVYRFGAGVNSDKGHFHVPPAAPEQVLQRIEALMRDNVPDAFFEMGNAYDHGYGVPRDADRAWAFWQLAADMGSPYAQTAIGKALNYGEGAQALKGGRAWANDRIAIQMFECATAQGHAPAAYELGLDLYVDAFNKTAAEARAQYERALRILHDGVKWGSERAANSLFAAFDIGKPLVGHIIDKARAERYSALGDALYFNPDLRFPNLDKVLPLPPAPLPEWDGNDEHLIDAAKAVVPNPRPEPPAPLTVAPNAPRVSAVDARAGTVARAPRAGYWVPRAPLRDARLDFPLEQAELLERAALEAPPEAFAHGQYLFPKREGTLRTLARDWNCLMHLQWFWAGPLPPTLRVKPDLMVDWRVRAGVAREPSAAPPVWALTPGVACPATGVWAARVDAAHPAAASFNHWERQCYVRAHEPLPVPSGTAVNPRDVVWTLVELDARPHAIGVTAHETIAARQQASRERMRLEADGNSNPGDAPFG